MKTNINGKNRKKAATHSLEMPGPLPDIVLSPINQ